MTSNPPSVDFQRDFLENGGFGEIQGGNLAAVQASVKPAAAILKLARRAGLTVVHTREGHDPALRDCPTSKVSPKPSHSDGCSEQLNTHSLRGRPMLRIQSTPW
jgi:nicotinamidase-related amidase